MKSEAEFPLKPEREPGRNRCNPKKPCWITNSERRLNENLTPEKFRENELL